MISSLPPTYYEILGVPLRASDEEIRTAYERAVARLESDGPGAAAAMQAQLLEAMEILTDPDLRQEYNRIERLNEKQVAPPHSGADVISAQPPSVEPIPEQLTLEALLEGTDITLPAPPQHKVSYVPRITRPEMEAVSLEMAQERVASEAAAMQTAQAQPQPQVQAESRPATPPTPSEVPSAERAPAEAPPVESRARISSAEFEDAQRAVEEQAIATAEAALARVAARVRDARAESRPRALEIPADAVFTGELLRKVRESRGLTIQQLCDRTRVSKIHLENIEADRYKALPATVYLRGILMNVARELALDPLRVARTYLEQVTGAGPQKGSN